MEEVDTIIIHSLKSIGCTIEETVNSLDLLSTEIIVEAVARCLKVINNDVDVAFQLPPSMSVRFRIGTTLANQVAELGYRGDLGYQSFLYPNEADIRKIFMFLIEKMPKESASAAKKMSSPSSILRTLFAAELSRKVPLAWVPPQNKKRSIYKRGDPPFWNIEGAKSFHRFQACFLFIPNDETIEIHETTADVARFNAKILEPVGSQLNDHRNLAASLIEFNTSQVIKSSMKNYEFSNDLPIMSEFYPNSSENALNLSVSKSITNLNVLKSQEINPENNQVKPENIEQVNYTDSSMNSEEQANILHDEFDKLQEDLIQLRLNIEEFDVLKKELSMTQSHLHKKIEENKSMCKLKKQTIELLPNAEENVTKLEQMVTVSLQRLENLNLQWDKHKTPLIEKYDKLVSESKNHHALSDKLISDIKILKKKIKDSSAEGRMKEETHRLLTTQLEKMLDGPSRASYTSKIMEIVHNIKKQKNEIDKILIETKSIQKEINQLNGKLDRTFAVTDELIFKDAKKEDSVRKAYKLLAALHENFNVLIETITETGQIAREIRDLEDQIDTERKKNISSNLERINNDYKQIKSENHELLSKIESK